MRIRIQSCVLSFFRDGVHSLSLDKYCAHIFSTLDVDIISLALASWAKYRNKKIARQLKIMFESREFS
jgi:hypothetical protein